MFIVSLNYRKSLEEVDSHLTSHVAYLKKQYEAGNFLASGRKIPRTGGIILSSIENREDLEEIIRQDPFHKHQIAEYEIIEFTPSMTCDELEFLKNK